MTRGRRRRRCCGAGGFQTSWAKQRRETMRKAWLPLLGLALIAILAQPATTDPGRGAGVQCYVWANNSSSGIGAPYTPSTLYSYNAVGRANANTVTRTAVGQYSVTCKGVGGGALFAGSGSWGAGGHV